MTTVAAVAGVGIVGALLLGLSNRQKTVIEQGKLSSRVWQGSEYGGDIPRIYGTVGIEGSQIVWLEHNKLKEKVKKKKSGGKGGGSSTTTKTYTYFATFALMLCQGEISGVRRIWCGDKLIYNAGSDDLETIIASNQAAKGWKLYRGTDDQLPDPRYEADVGVGNAPAFRGYTYIAFYDFALADYSNTLQAAQFKVELMCKSDYEVQLSGVITRSYSIPNDNPAFNAKPYFISDEKVVFYSPQWATSYPPTSTFDVYEIYAGGFVNKYSIPATGIVSGTVPPNGKSETDGEYWLSGADVFGTPLTMFYGVDGYIEKKYGIYVGLSSTGGLYSRVGGDNDYEIFNIPSSSRCFAIGPDYIYAISVSGITVYTHELVLVSSHSLSIPGASSNPCRADFDGEILRIYGGTNGTKLYKISADLSSIDSEITIPAEVGNSYFTISVGFFADLIVRAYGVVGTELLTVEWINTNGLVDEVTTLADVITAECELSSLISADDLDVSLLTQAITGYRVSGGMIRSVIEPLQGAYPFDVVPSGYKIKFVPRGKAPVVTIPWEDLAAANGDEIGDSLPYSREMDSQLPQKVTITALSSTREYGAATQSYERMNTSAVNVEQRDIPLVLSDDEIAQMAEKLLFLRWLERDDFDFSLPPTYLALEPADVPTVQAKFGTFELRLTDINYEQDGRLTCKAKLNNAALYTSNAVGATSPGPDGTIGLRGPSLTVLADAPMVYETEQNSPGISTAVTGYSDGWPGSVLVRSADAGQTWVDLQGYSGKGTIGYAVNALSSNSGALIYEGSGLQVNLVSGELESITADQMLAGSNIALYGAAGRWEVIRFRDAALQGDGSYILTGLIRGDKGTEWATGLHQIGDYFVLAGDPDNAFVGLPIETIGISMLYRGVTAGASVDSASDQELTYRGVNLKPLSPATPIGLRNSSGDLSASWSRRSRFSSSWWITGVSAPVGEDSEAYEADVMSGSTVKRTITSTSQAITYSATDQITDFGSTQATITLRIYQISSAVGRGYPLEVTL